jgi:hypothetical protein
MTYELDGIITHPQGDARIISYTVTEEDTGNAVNLSSATIDWQLNKTREDTTVLSLSDSGVSIQNRDNGAGTFEVKIDTGATDNLAVGLYEEIVQVTDGQGDRTTWIGSFQIVRDK